MLPFYKGRSGIICFLLTIALIAMSSPAVANWSSARDKSMTLKEKGHYIQAYSLASSQRVSGEDLFDKEFVSGWLALRSLGKPQLAFNHFKNMALYTKHLRRDYADAGKAKAGYWLGRTLKELGKGDQANVMFKAAFGYPNTFYGQLSGSELGISLKRHHVQHLSSQYPIKDIYWHDPRVRKEYVLATIREESRFKQRAKSPKEARGMMQVLDGTAKSVGKQAGVNIDITMMRNNADYNIAVGSRYLADQMASFSGNTMLASAAYNAGPKRPTEWIRRFGDPRGGRVDPIDWAESIPFKETRDYVQKVIGSYVTYVALLKTE